MSAGRYGFAVLPVGWPLANGSLANNSAREQVAQTTACSRFNPSPTGMVPMYVTDDNWRLKNRSDPQCWQTIPSPAAEYRAGVLSSDHEDLSDETAARRPFSICFGVIAVWLPPLQFSGVIGIHDKLILQSVRILKKRRIISLAIFRALAWHIFDCTQACSL